MLLFTANRSRISIKNLFPLYVFYNVQHEKTDSYIYFLQRAKVWPCLHPGKNYRRHSSLGNPTLLRIANAFCFQLLISALTPKTHRKQRFQDSSDGTPEYVGTCAGAYVLHLPRHYVPLRILRSGSVPLRTILELCWFSVQAVVRARASAENLKSKAILKELNCPTGRNVSLNFCQVVNFRNFRFLQKI